VGATACTSDPTAAYAPHVRQQAIPPSTSGTGVRKVLEANEKRRLSNARVALFLAVTQFLHPEMRGAGRALTHSIRAAGKLTGWITLFAIAGTLSAVAAVAINEAFVTPSLLILTVGEWELLAVVFYILAIICYLAEGGGRSRSM